MITNTFEDYLKEQKTLSFEQMQSLHREMIDEIGDDPDAKELYDELVEIATKYAAMRADWQQMSREEKMDRDS